VFKPGPLVFSLENSLVCSKQDSLSEIDEEETKNMASIGQLNGPKTDP